MLHKFIPRQRPPHEQERERKFIKAVNNLKTLRVTPRGGMSIHPEEIRDLIVELREKYKVFVKR
jgi:hypothetical protein